MIKSRIAVAGALLAVAGAAGAAGLTITPTVVSDYDWRGYSQTNPDQDGDIFGGPAFQLGVNYGLENGFYVGGWASNVDFGGAVGDPSVEVDAFAGFAGGDAADGIGYDVGANFYYYLSGSGGPNFVEAYAGISSGMFSGKVWFSPEFANTSDSSIYVEGNVTYPLPSNFSLTGHVGYSLGDAYLDEYLDYSVGVGYTINKFNLGAKWVSTGADNYDDDKIVFSVSTTLPWSE